MDSALAQVLAALSRAFGREQVPWYLFGARAAVLYGSRRLTADVDVSSTNDSSPSDIAKIEEVVARFPIIEERNEMISTSVMARPVEPGNTDLEFVDLRGIGVEWRSRVAGCIQRALSMIERVGNRRPGRSARVGRQRLGNGIVYGTAAGLVGIHEAKSQAPGNGRIRSNCRIAFAQRIG